MTSFHFSTGRMLVLGIAIMVIIVSAEFSAEFQVNFAVPRAPPSQTGLPELLWIRDHSGYDNLSVIIVVRDGLRFPEQQGSPDQKRLYRLCPEALDLRCSQTDKFGEVPDSGTLRSVPTRCVGNTSPDPGWWGSLLHAADDPCDSGTIVCCLDLC